MHSVPEDDDKDDNGGSSSSGRTIGGWWGYGWSGMDDRTIISGKDIILSGFDRGGRWAAW